MGQQKRFTKEFEDEAVRLALTTGRTRRADERDASMRPPAEAWGGSTKAGQLHLASGKADRAVVKTLHNARTAVAQVPRSYRDFARDAAAQSIKG